MNDNDTIQRCPHDRENPYAQISRDLIRDNSISPECRWLLIFLLSNSENFTINPKQIINHLQGFKNCGRDRVYEIIEEALDAGYMKREAQVVKNLNNGYKYYVSEKPKFKKCFRHPECQDTGGQYTGKTAIKEEQGIKKEQKKETTTTPTPSKIESAVVPSIQDELRNSKLTTEQSTEAIKYYESNPDKFKDSKIKNIVGYIIHMVEAGKHKEDAKKQEIIEKRKAWAEKSQFHTGNGCLQVLKDAILKISGKNEEVIKFDSNHTYWEKNGLAFN